ncbi:hypothetical protein C1645_743135 [Glomus cerebriforme]|uniref:TLDc domain-containing protein n=1 Tax=Glomus cerebriforme TaxID=658196 RepID=A0A397SAK6_9GLOM|nr:hypothetical protein C1645_743135 [Glomus cerebriforme]
MNQENILKNFERIFKTGENYDVIIEAGEEPKPKKNLRPFLHSSLYLCCGKIDLSINSISDALEILVATDELSLNDPDDTLMTLKDYCLETICQVPDRKDVPLKKNPYKFNLIFRASRDGGGAADFHAKCDDQGATIVVAKIEETDRVIGGYDWKGNRGIIGRVIQTEHAIRCFSKYGPVFGYNNGGGNDIMVTEHGKWSSATNSYPNINIPKIFKIDDYEVFQVVKG